MQGTRRRTKKTLGVLVKLYLARVFHRELSCPQNARSQCVKEWKSARRDANTERWLQ